MKTKSNHVALVVDASGSMHKLREPAKEGIAAQINALQDEGADQKNLLTLIPFSTVVEPPLVKSTDVNTLSAKLAEAYRPGGQTAMLDGIGAAIELLETTPIGEDEDASFLVHIISDGLEINSVEWTWDALRAKITALQETERWTFTFLGANQNVQRVGQCLGIPMDNLAAFQATVQDTERVMADMKAATIEHMSIRRAGLHHSNDLMKKKQAAADARPSAAPPLGSALDAAIPDPRRLIRTIEERNTNPGSHCHGPDHWKCVAMSGLTLLEKVADADPIVVLLFALLHDSQRVHDGRDRGHGHRAAALAVQLHGAYYHLRDKQLEQLVAACFDHNGGTCPQDATVAVCWDADRLNLWRVGHEPDPARLVTEAGRCPELIAASADHVFQKFSWVDIFAAYRRLPRRA